MDVKTVAIIGAGVSGVSSAIHLKNAGLEVTVFERGDVAGGVWYVWLSFILFSSIHVLLLFKAIVGDRADIPNQGIQQSHSTRTFIPINHTFDRRLTCFRRSSQSHE